MSNKKTFIIGDAGLNHNGNQKLLKILIDGAVDAKIDAIKFQKRTVDKVYTKEFLSQPRNDGNPYNWKTQGEQKNGIELDEETYDWINEYCKKKSILWGCSAWDIDSQLFLRKYNLSFNKIASAMIIKTDFLRIVAEEGKLTYISTGMANFNEIQIAVDIFREYNCPFILLHCNSCYPSRNEDAALPMINILAEKFGCLTGYSSHEQGRLNATNAVARGAVVIEKHISFNRDEKSYEQIKEHLVKSKVKEFNSLTGNYDEVVKILPYGSDQWASITLDEMKKLVVDVRQTEAALNLNIDKILSEGELKTKAKLRGD